MKNLIMISLLSFSFIQSATAQIPAELTQVDAIIDDGFQNGAEGANFDNADGSITIVKPEVLFDGEYGPFFIRGTYFGVAQVVCATMYGMNEISEKSRVYTQRDNTVYNYSENALAGITAYERGVADLTAVEISNSSQSRIYKLRLNDVILTNDYSWIVTAVRCVPK